MHIEVRRMFPLGHLGISMGIALALAYKIGKKLDSRSFFLGTAVGSLLPDFIDKPIGFYLGYPGGGRLVAHTILFALILSLAVFLFLRYSRFDDIRKKERVSALLCFGLLGSWVHLLLDRMWWDLDILLWPAYGVQFPKGEFSLCHLALDPWAWGGEILGGTLLLLFAVFYLKNVAGLRAILSSRTEK